LVDELAAKVAALKRDLLEQWESNHSEHCGVPIPPWPNEGECHWKLPESVSSSEAYLYLRGDGEQEGEQKSEQS
jgi:hypothetical protein